MVCFAGGVKLNAGCWCMSSTNTLIWGVERGLLVARPGVQRWDTWTGASQGWGHLWIWSLSAVLGSQLKVGPTPFCSSHREQSDGAAAVDGQVLKQGFPGSVSGRIPELLVLSRASQVLREQLWEHMEGEGQDTTRQGRWPLGQGSLGHLLGLGGQSLCSHFVLDTWGFPCVSPQATDSSERRFPGHNFTLQIRHVGAFKDAEEALNFRQSLAEVWPVLVVGFECLRCGNWLQYWSHFQCFGACSPSLPFSRSTNK